MTITKKQAQRLHGLIAQNDQALKVWYHSEGAQMARTAADATRTKAALNEFIAELTESGSDAEIRRLIVGDMFKPPEESIAQIALRNSKAASERWDRNLVPLSHIVAMLGDETLNKKLAETYELNTAIRKESNVEIKVSNTTTVKNIKPGEKFRVGSYEYLKVGDADAGNGQTFNAVNLQTNMLASLLPLTTAELSSKPIKASELKVGDMFVKDGKLGIRSENLKGDYAEVAFAGSDANGLHIDAEVYRVKSVSVNI